MLRRVQTMMPKQLTDSELLAQVIPVGVILTAGLGQRLYPLNQCRPKALMPLCNQRLLDYQIDTMRALGVNTLILQMRPGRAARQIQAHIDQHDGHAAADSQLRFVFLLDQQPELFGMTQLRTMITTHFALTSCDRLCRFPLDKLRRRHFGSAAHCTYALASGLGEQVAGWFCDESGRMTRYAKQGGAGSLEHAGLLLASPHHIEQMLFPTADYPFDFGDDPPWFGYPPQSAMFWSHVPAFRVNPAARWFAAMAPEVMAVDVGTPARYLQTHFQMLREDVPLPPPTAGYARREARGWVHETAGISATARLYPPYMIGPNTTIAAGAEIGPLVVIGKDGVVGRNAGIRHTILWDHVTVNDHITLDGSVVADRVTVSQSARHVLLSRHRDLQKTDELLQSTTKGPVS